MHNIVSEDSLHPQIKSGNEYHVDYDRYIVISKVIENYYANLGHNVIFVDSSANIEGCIKNINEGIVLFDLVYDNKITMERLNRLLSFIVSFNKNIIVIPIPCIEWYFIKVFGKDSELRDIVLNFKDYRDTDIYKFNMNHKKANNEKFCKAVFGELVDKRFHSTCDAHEYNISSIDEQLLCDSLPIINDIIKGVNYNLKNQYYFHINKFTYHDNDVEIFKQHLSNYLSMLNLFMFKSACNKLNK